MADAISGLVLSQRRFFSTNVTKDVEFRIEQLKKLKAAILAFEDEIKAALHSDLHKCELEAYSSEIGFCLNEISQTIQNLKKWAKPEKAWGMMLPLSEGTIISEPFGVALIIAPWNYPFGLAISPLIGAIAAGNCAVVKPSEVSSSTSKVIAKLVAKTFDEKYIAVVEGDSKVASKILEEKFDYIFFTGGEFVGKIVMQAAAKNLTPLTLELGGKSPCIVSSDCDLEKTASRIVWGKFFNAGQTCIAPDYLLVQKEVKEKLIEKMKEKIIKFYGENEKNSKDYGRIINKRHFERLSSYLKEGRIIFGGKTDANELFISPTLIEQMLPKANVMQDEIFGPILPIIEYSKLEEAIEFVTNRPKPLALYLFSSSREIQNKILNETSSGGVCINDTIIHISSESLPFGGVGSSGFGKYHGKASFDTFSNKKSVLKNTTLFDLPRYPPYGDFALKMMKSQFK